MLRLPLLRRAPRAPALATVFLACEEEPTVAPPDTPSDLPPVLFAGHSDPVWPGDFADPSILVTGSAYYAYATNHGPANVPVLRSADLSSWTAAGDALPVLPTFAQPRKGGIRAPSGGAVDRRDRVFFTARRP